MTATDTVTINLSSTPTISGLTTLNGGAVLGDAVTDALTLTGAIQGANALVFDGATDNSNEITLAITDPGADYTITLPAETGTICTTGSVCSGYAASTGASGYIQNGTSLQSTANFNIRSVATGSVTANFQVLAGQTADVIRVRNSSDSATYFAVEADGDAYFGANVSLAANQSLTLTGGNTASRPASPAEGMLYYDTTTKQLLTYANGKWQGDRAGASRIVAANDSSQFAKDSADYVADGENSAGAGTGTIDGDQVQINNALTAVSSAGGGTVYLMEGTYTIDASISIPNGVTLAGSGASTLIQLGNFGGTSTTIDAITNSDTSTGTRIVIRDLRIDGRDSINTAGSQTAIYLNGMGGGTGASARPGAKITNTIITNFRNDGISLSASSNGTFSGNTIEGNDYGVRTATGASYNTFTGNISQGNTNGFQANSAYNTFTGNTSQGNSNTGILLNTSAASTTITGNTFQGNAYGIYDNDADYVTITGNNVVGNSSNGIVISSTNNSTISGNAIYSTSAAAGLYVNSSDYNNITGNNIFDSGGATTNSGIHILNDSDYNNVTGNYIADSSCTTSCYAIYIVDSTMDANYLADNRYLTTAGTNQAYINDAGTNTRYASQAVAGNTLQSGSSIVKALATSVLSGSIDPTASTSVTGVSTKFTTELQVGDRITVTGETRTVTVITSDTALTVDTAFSDNANDTSVDRLPAAFAVKDSSGTNQVVVQDNGNVTLTANLTVNGSTTIGDAVTDSLTVTSAIQGTNALVFDGSTDNTNEITLAVTDPGADFTITLPAATGTVPLQTSNFTTNGVLYATGNNTVLSTVAGLTGECLIGNTGSTPSWGACGTTSGYIIQVPGSTAQNTITPTAASVVGLTVNGTSGTAATAVNIVQTGAAASLAVSNSNASTTSIATITGTNTSGTQTNGLLIERNGASGTTTNLLNLTQTSGTATNGLSFNGSFGTSIYFANGSGSIGTTSSGYVNIQGGTSGVTINASNTNSGTSGGLTLASGTNSSTGNSGAVSMASGSVQTGNSGGITLATGSVGFSGISGNITISTGDTNGGGGGTPGSISVDTGFISGGSTSQINIGTSNSRNNTLGNTQNSTVTTIRGGNTTTALNLAVATNGYLNLNNTGVANVIQIGTTTGAVAQTINIGNNTTASSNNQITIGSTIGSSQVTLQGNVAINNLSSTSGTTFVCRNASSLFSSCTNTPLTNALQDNIADAFDLQQGSDNYINIRTSDGTENISFGNATTNPSYSFLGTGTVTLAGDLAVNGDDITSDGNLTVNATGYVRIGDTGTPGVASGDDDLYVESDLEVDATATIAGNLTVSGLQTLDSSANSGINHISIRNSNAGSSATGGLQFGQDTSATVSYIFQNSSTNTGWGGSNSFNILNTFNAPIVLHTNSAERLRLTGAGDAYFNGTASTSQLEVRDGTSTTVTLLVVDSTNDRVYIGDTSTDTTGTLLVLDVKTDSGDPTGVAGAMYYNSNSNSFRCYTTSWSACDTTGSGASKWGENGGSSFNYLANTGYTVQIGTNSTSSIYTSKKLSVTKTNSTDLSATIYSNADMTTTTASTRTFNTYFDSWVAPSTAAGTATQYINLQSDIFTGGANLDGTYSSCPCGSQIINASLFTQLGDGTTDAAYTGTGLDISSIIDSNFTVNTFTGIQVHAPDLAASSSLARNNIGITVQEPDATGLGRINNHTNILIDPNNTPASGDWSIYNNSDLNNYFAGNLAIGTGGTAPSYALDVADSQSTSYVARIQNTDTANTADGLLIDLGVANGSRTTSNYFVGFAGAGTVAGKIQGGASAVAYTTTAADYAEYFKTDANNKPQAAELVTLDPSDNYAVKRSNGPATTPIVGAISTNPGFIGNGPICAVDDNNCDANYANYNALVALSGQVPVLVDNSNGAIAIGDPITSSNIAGRGAKATGPSYIVGYAMEPLSGTNGTIRVLIRPEYYSPTPTSILAQDVTTTSLAVSGTASINNLNVTNDVAITNNITVSGDAIFSGNVTVAGTTQLQTLVVSGDTSVQNITINGKIISQGNTPTAVLGEAVIVGQGSEVAVSGNDTAGSLSYTSGSVNLPSYNVTNGAQVEVQFSEAYAQVPRIALTAKGSSSASVRYYVETTTSGFTVHFIDAPQGSTTYTFDYIVIQ